MKKKQILDDLKLLIRVAEGVMEVFLLALIFDVILHLFYLEKAFPVMYIGKELKLLLIIYTILVTIVFVLCDCFYYGHVKLIDMIISQWVSVFIVNFISYFILWLVAYHAVSAAPMILCVAIDVVVTALCSWLYTAIYHKLYVPQNMLLIYGNEN